MFKGTGEFLLELSFNHYVLIELDEGEEIIVDNKLFFAAGGTVDLIAKMIKSVSGGPGPDSFPYQLRGKGIVRLEILCQRPKSLNISSTTTPESRWGFCLLRSGQHRFHRGAARTTGSPFGSAVSGEGFLNVFRGPVKSG